MSRIFRVVRVTSFSRATPVGAVLAAVDLDRPVPTVAGAGCASRAHTERERRLHRLHAAVADLVAPRAAGAVRLFVVYAVHAVYAGAGAAGGHGGLRSDRSRPRSDRSRSLVGGLHAAATTLALLFQRLGPSADEGYPAPPFRTNDRTAASARPPAPPCRRDPRDYRTTATNATNATTHTTTTAA
jgi:hypothetical protein